MFASAASRTLVAGAAAVALFAAAAMGDTPVPNTETASSGTVAATLTFGGSLDQPSAARLTIARSGAVVFDQAIPDAVCDGCRLLGQGADVHVADLDGDGEPEVVVGSDTGGSQCCQNIGIYDFRAATGTYGAFVRSFQNGDFDVSDYDGDGIRDFRTFDRAFVGRYSARASSWPPPVFLHYVRTGGVPRYIDVTTHFPGQIADDARAARHAFTDPRPGGPAVRASVAGYIADEYLLFHGRSGLRELDHLIAHGTLGSLVSAVRFRTKLLRDLRAFGYR